MRADVEHPPKQVLHLRTMVRVEANALREHLARSIVLDTRPRLPDEGIAVARWTTVETLSGVPAIWRYTELGVERVEFRRVGTRVVPYLSKSYVVRDVTQTRSEFDVEIRRWAIGSMEFLDHALYGFQHFLLSHRLRREPRGPHAPALRPGFIVALVAALAIACIALAALATSGQFGIEVLVVGAGLAIAVMPVLWQSRTAWAASFLAGLLSLVAVGLIAWAVRLLPGVPVPVVFGVVTIGFGAAASFVACVDGAMRRSLPRTAAPLVVVAALSLAAPAVAGPTLRIPGAAFEPIRALALRGYPNYPPTISPTVALTPAPPVRQAAIAAPPPLEANRLHPGSLPSDWGWCNNGLGGHSFIAGSLVIHVDTTSDYALNGYDIDDAVDEWDQLAIDHRPGFRRTDVDRRSVFGAEDGARLKFDWIPRDDRRPFRGVTYIAVSDGHSYTATLIWPVADEDSQLVDEGRRILDQLRIVTERDVAEDNAELTEERHTTIVRPSLRPRA